MKKEHQNKTHAHFLGIVSELNEFHTIPSQNFTTHNLHNIVSGMHRTSSKRISPNMILLFQMCDTFDRTTIGRTWLVGVTSQDHPGST